MEINAKDIYYIDKDGNSATLDKILEHIADKIKEYDILVRLELDFKNKMIDLMNDADDSNDDTGK